MSANVYELRGTEAFPKGYGSFRSLFCDLLLSPSRGERCPARSGPFLSYQTMDRTFEDLRHEVLELDPASQRRLAEEIEEKLSESEWDEDSKEEIRRRLEKHRRGEGTYMTAEESLAKGRAMIEAAKAKQR